MPKQVLTRLVIFAALFAYLVGCSSGGDTDGGKAGDETFEGTQYVPTDDSAGSIELIVEEPNIPVSQITGFFVRVVDRNGAGVPQLRIACDSEEGVAIIEPTSGFEITDSSGQISGKIGCEAPGSYQFACRLPVGGNKRKFVDIKCTGDVPTGFNGFPGSTGGTLGGGEQVTDDGGPGGTDTDGIRLTSVLAEELGESTEQVDVVLGLCGEDDPATVADERTIEPFTDARLKVRVTNNTNSIVEFTRLFYTVPNFDGTGRTFRSSGLALIGEATVESNGGEAEISTLAFSATGTGGDKFFVNASSGNSAIGVIGFRNVTVTLVGVAAAGQTVEVSGTVTISFSNYNNC